MHDGVFETKIQWDPERIEISSLKIKLSNFWTDINLSNDVIILWVLGECFLKNEWRSASVVGVNIPILPVEFFSEFPRISVLIPLLFRIFFFPALSSSKLYPTLCARLLNSLISHKCGPNCCSGRVFCTYKICCSNTVWVFSHEWLDFEIRQAILQFPFHCKKPNTVKNFLRDIIQYYFSIFCQPNDWAIHNVENDSYWIC